MCVCGGWRVCVCGVCVEGLGCVHVYVVHACVEGWRGLGGEGVCIKL